MSWEDFLALGARHRESDPDAVNRADGRDQPRTTC